MSLLMSILFSLGGLPTHPQKPHSWRTSLSLLVWPLSYGLSGLGGPTWVTTKRDMTRLEAAEMRFLRSVKGYQDWTK